MNSIENNFIFNTIDNGIIVLDENLNIKVWNRWLELKTDIKASDICEKNICEEFDYINKKRLQRKIKSVFVTKNPSFFNADPHKYLIKIKSNSIMGKIFKYMRQDITIVPYDIEKKLVCLYIYDNTKLHEVNEKLKKLNEDLKELSTRDSLTGLYNRRFFSDSSPRMQSLAIRHGHDISLIILDIDNFKKINDTYGHAVGDKVIVSLSNILQNNSRKSDFVIRFGGEEFLVLLYDASLSFGEKIAENIRKTVENSELIIKDNNIKYSLSLGVACFDEKQDNNLESTTNRADKALYKAKTRGKNQVVVSL